MANYLAHSFVNPSVCTMSIVNSVKKKIRQISILATRNELKSVLDLTVQNPPAGARYKIGDTIQVAENGTALRDLKVYGIKAGGYGFAYIVLDEETLSPYCLKTFRGRFVDSSSLAQFKREADIWIRLGRHPNLVYAHSVLKIGSRPYILFEYVAGPDLWCKIRNDGIPVGLALKYAIQFCRGMAYAQHKLPGFVHGDVKPNNCLLTPDDTLKIADFGHVTLLAEPQGLSKIHASDCPSSAGTEIFDIPVSSWRTGTPPYMAPEQFDAANKIDTRADVYGFGITLFEMLTGKRPFKGMEHEECFAQHKSATPTDPVSLNPDIPQPLARLILECLAKSPAERPGDFNVLEKELSSLLWTIQQEEVPSAPPDELTKVELINRGISLTSLDHYDEALACFDHVLSIESIEPQFASAWSHKGNVLTVLDRYDEALVCFDRALNLDPQLAFAWGRKGKVLERLNRFDEALICFDKALTLDPRLAFVWNDKAHTLGILGQVKESMTCLNRALALDPQHFEIHDNLGIGYQKLGRDEEAIKAFKQVINLNPVNAEAHCNLGNIYSRSERMKEAIESYRRALSLKSNYAEARHKLGDAYRAFCFSSKPLLREPYAQKMVGFLLSEQNDPNETIRLFDDFMQLTDFDPKVFYLCSAKVFEVLEMIDRQQAERLVDTLARVRENIVREPDQETFYWLGKIYYRLNLYNACREVFRQSVMLCGPDDKALYYLGACSEISRNHEIALNYYKEALLFDPGCSLTLDGIDRMEAELASHLP